MIGLLEDSFGVQYLHGPEAGARMLLNYIAREKLSPLGRYALYGARFIVAQVSPQDLDGTRVVLKVSHFQPKYIFLSNDVLISPTHIANTYQSLVFRFGLSHDLKRSGARRFYGAPCLDWRVHF